VNLTDAPGHVQAITSPSNSTPEGIAIGDAPVVGLLINEFLSAKEMSPARKAPGSFGL
jgi:hypothetical protein